MRSRSLLGEFELMVLLVVIRLGEQAYGVPICAEIEHRTGREAAVSSVYAALERLEEKGFVSSFHGEPSVERGGRAKRFFQVTCQGLGAARQTRQALTSLWTGLPKLERGTV